VGEDGTGCFIQSGGEHRVAGVLQIGNVSLTPIALDASAVAGLRARGTETNVWLPPPIDSHGTYELSGGRLSAGEILIKDGGVLRQSGGASTAAHLSIAGAARCEYLGGTLEISEGVDLRGALDFGSSSAVLRAGGIVNLAAGRVVGAGNASLIVGGDSLTILAPGFDPDSQFRRFRAGGIVHVAGSPLAVAGGEGFSGWGRIDDHVDCAGRIRASAGGSIDLTRGLYVRSRGVVDLGAGVLTVRNEESGMDGGALSAGEVRIGGPRFIRPWPGYDSDPPGGSAGGEVLPEPMPWLVPSRFAQRGGTARIAGVLEVGRGTYELSGGSLSAEVARITDSLGGHGRFRQAGGEARFGSVQVGRLPLTPVPQGAQAASTAGGDAWMGDLPEMTLPDPLPPRPERILPVPPACEISGGVLTAGSMQVGGWGEALFVQTGGTVAVEEALRVSGGGTLTMVAGTLTVTNLEVESAYSGAAGLVLASPQAEVVVSGRLVLGRGSTFAAAAGSRVRLGGKEFRNTSTDAEALAGLGAGIRHGRHPGTPYRWKHLFCRITGTSLRSRPQAVTIACLHRQGRSQPCYECLS